MSTIVQDKTQSALAVNVIVFVAACLAVNGLIFASGWQDEAGTATNAYLPPGWVVGAVWVSLFAAMGVARWMLLDHEEKTLTERRLILLLAAFCLAYPFYTRGLADAQIGQIGNVATAVAAFFVASRVWRIRPAAGALIALVGLWASYATFATLAG